MANPLNSWCVFLVELLCVANRILGADKHLAIVIESTTSRRLVAKSGEEE